MLDFGALILGDGDLLLRPLVVEDARALALAAAESRDSYAFTPVPNGVTEAEAYVAHALEMKAAGERYPFTIVLGDRIVGTSSYYDFQPWRWPRGCDLQRRDRPDAVEIGYTWLAASVQRTSCNTRAKLVMLTHAFEQFQVHRVSLRTDERNQRSRRAIERLGAKLDGVLRAHRPGSDCTIRNTASFSILAAEWPTVRARLHGHLRR